MVIRSLEVSSFTTSHFVIVIALLLLLGSRSHVLTSCCVLSELWGMPFPDPYMDLYNASALAVKGVNPSYRVGGPATAQLNGDLGGVAAFVNESTTRGIPFDFVSTHFYPSSGDRTSFKPCAGGDFWDPSCFAQQMALTRAAIPEDKEFLLTEYNAGCCMQYYQHDNSGAAAFAFRSVGEAAGITGAPL